MLAIDGFLSDDALELLYKFALEVNPFSATSAVLFNLQKHD